MRAIVVGSGVGSLASALRLRALGHEVDVLEACSDAGGRAREFSFHGHRFDAVPTLITAPELFDELFALFGERRADSIEFIPCDPWRRILYGDGSRLDVVASIERQESEIARLSPEDARNYRAFVRHGERFYKVGYEEFCAKDFSSFSSKLSIAPKLFQLGGFSTLWRHTARYFSDTRVRQAFSLPPLLTGGDPLSATAMCGLAHTMERAGGVWVAQGGVSALTRALVNLGERHGIRFHFKHNVASFSRDSSGRVTSVQCAHRGEQASFECDLCVWGGDPRVLYSTLGTEGLSFAEKVRQKMVKPSTALYMLYFKTRRPYHRVAPHTVVLSQRWEGLVRDICKGRKLPKDPILNLYRPGANDPSLRARDGDLFTVVAPVPHLGNYDGWKFDATRFKDTVLSILEDRVLPGLPAALVFAEAVDPRYFRDVLMSPLGAGISAGSLSPQSTWFQFPNCMEKVRNLYVCGAAPPPGGGLAGVVASAKLIERSVRRDFPSVQEYQSPLSEIAARSVA